MAETSRTAETLWDALGREEVELDSGVSWEEVVSTTLQSVDIAYRASGDEARVSLHACWVDWIIQQWAHVDRENARLAAEIAANQSRAFEDGALTMRERAEFRARAWMMPELPPGTYTEASERIAAGIQARNEAAVGIADGIAALPLQPEGERGDA